MGRRPRLLLLGPVVAAWAALPRIVSPPFQTASANEVADHLVPGAVVLVISLWALLGTRRRQQSPIAMLSAGLVISLAGLWMGATHLPLVLQALRHEAPWPATIHHGAASVAVLVYGAAWTAKYWNAAPEEHGVIDASSPPPTLAEPGKQSDL